MHVVLDLKYISLVSLKLERFKKKSEKLFNFRCPYCGDSHKDKTKARGYLYRKADSFSYKCHNCGTTASMVRFLGHVDASLANAYRMERFAALSPSVTPIFKNEPEKKDDKPKLGTNALLRLGMIRVSDMSEDSRVVEYVKYRKIPESQWNDLYYTKDMKVCEKLNPLYIDRLVSEERLVIPFYDSSGNLSGVSGRALGNSKIRYVTVRITDYPLVYGLRKIDRNKTVYIVEGPIDSMFVPNSMAAGGSDFQRAIAMVQDCDTVLVFDNEPRNKEIVKLMESMIAKNKRMVIWPNNWVHKDMNAAIIAGVNQKELMSVINSRTFDGLQLKLEMREWKKV